MPCGKVCEKLWNNYLNKYGDFRERLQIIRTEQKCSVQFQLPSIKQQSLSVQSPVVNRKCDPLLPSECCRLSMTKNNRSFVLNKTDRDNLEKLIEAENFPENIFSVNNESRPSIELSMTDNLHRLTSSMFSQNDVSHSITQNNDGSSIHRSIQKSEIVTSSHDRIKNPYAQLIERLRKGEKTNIEDSNTINEIPSQEINTNTHNHIQKFLSFLHSLDDNTLDENTLIALFSVDNHLLSSIYVQTNIQQVNIIPKTILHSLKSTSDNEHILNQIQTETSRKLNSNFLNINKQQSDQISNFVDQDNELNSRLVNTYTIKAFKDFLIHRNKSAPLPKLFYDLDRYYQNQSPYFI